MRSRLNFHSRGENSYFCTSAKICDFSVILIQFNWIRRGFSRIRRAPEEGIPNIGIVDSVPFCVDVSPSHSHSNILDALVCMCSWCVPLFSFYQCIGPVPPITNTKLPPTHISSVRRPRLFGSTFAVCIAVSLVCRSDADEQRGRH